MENPCTFLLAKKKTWKRIFNNDSELSQNRTGKQIMTSKTTIKWLFNDIWCYLFIEGFIISLSKVINNTYINLIQDYVRIMSQHPIRYAVLTRSGTFPKKHPTGFFTVTSTNIRISHQNFQTCSFNPFARVV